jgi:hypothetical protein
MEIDKQLDLESNTRRCRELYDTGVLMDGNRNPFTQSVFIELMIRLRHIQHCLEEDTRSDPVTKLRNASAHPEAEDVRRIGDSCIYVDFCRTFDGNWFFEKETGTFRAQDETCDVTFQYGDHKISAKEIEKRIQEYETRCT